MNFADFIVPPHQIPSNSWQLGSTIGTEIPENGVALLWVSDFRGAAGAAESIDFYGCRQKLYELSKLDFEVPISDLGDLISGRTFQDTHYVLQEVLSACFYKNCIPVIIGGSDDLSYSMFYALNFHHKNLTYTRISNTVSLENTEGDITTGNVLSRILASREFSVKNFNLLGYQKHQNDPASINLIKDVDFEVVRLAEMMGSTGRCEPYFRHADLFTLNCNSLESSAGPISTHPEVNGLNRREICAYMKEAGLSEKLKAAAIFNFNFNGDELNEQLLAQMVWYLLEGINIRKSHPSERQYETYWVMAGERNLAFQRDSFTNLWYFGDSENPADWMPCAQEDYDLAKKGIIRPKFINK